LIIIQRVLGGLLGETTDEHRKELALHFCEHVIARRGEVLAPQHLDICQRYLDAVGKLLSREIDVHVVGELRDLYFDSRGDLSGLPGQISWLVETAASICCQRELEAAGFCVAQRYVPQLSELAKDAQKAMGEQCEARDEVIWEEAKWQLLRLIETTQRPRVSR
jgi:hypothetical protein